eukprot:362325-Pyramimonas_sp.AAC.1
MTWSGAGAVAGGRADAGHEPGPLLRQRGGGGSHVLRRTAPRAGEYIGIRFKGLRGVECILAVIGTGGPVK